jgi:hypothetical protein
MFGRRGQSPIADVLICQRMLAQAARGFGGAMDVLAGSLGRATVELGKCADGIGIELDKLNRTRADWEQIVRLIDSGDMDACVRLRDDIMRRAKPATGEGGFRQPPPEGADPR